MAVIVKTPKLTLGFVDKDGDIICFNLEGDMNSSAVNAITDYVEKYDILHKQDIEGLNTDETYIPQIGFIHIFVGQGSTSTIPTRIEKSMRGINELKNYFEKYVTIETAPIDSYDNSFDFMKIDFTKELIFEAIRNFK